MAGVNSTVATLGAGIPQPIGNADTIVKSLEPITAGRDVIRAAAETGRIPDYTPSKGCSGTGGGTGLATQLGLATAQAGVQAGASAIKIGTTALNAIPVLGSVLSSAVSLITAPFAHHKQAVANEQATLCVAVPDANNFLAIVDQYVQQGQWDHATALQQMEAGFAAWRQEVAGILKDTGGKCNAACVYEKAFRAAIEKRKLDYLQIEATMKSAGGALGVVSGISNVVSNSLTSGVGAITDFVKKQSAAVQSGNYAPVIGVLLAGAFIFGTFFYLSKFGMNRRATA